jgi:hypothetical protein
MTMHSVDRSNHWELLVLIGLAYMRVGITSLLSEIVSTHGGYVCSKRSHLREDLEFSSNRTRITTLLLETYDE